MEVYRDKGRIQVIFAHSVEQHNDLRQLENINALVKALLGDHVKCDWRDDRTLDILEV